MPSVTQPMSKGTQSCSEGVSCEPVSLCTTRNLNTFYAARKKKLVTSAEGTVFVSVLIFVHFPEAVCSCTAQGKCCGVASAKGNVYSDGLKLLGNCCSVMLLPSDRNTFCTGSYQLSSDSPLL